MYMYQDFNQKFKIHTFFIEEIRYLHVVRVRIMVFNATFNNISGTFCISWWSVLLGVEIYCSIPEKTTDLPHVTDKLYHIVL
jgi:hypothetical protein